MGSLYPYWIRIYHARHLPHFRQKILDNSQFLFRRCFSTRALDKWLDAVGMQSSGSQSWHVLSWLHMTDFCDMGSGHRIPSNGYFDRNHMEWWYIINFRLSHWQNHMDVPSQPWRNPHYTGVSINGVPIAGWFIRDFSPSINGWWLGVPLWLRKPLYMGHFQ